MTTSLSAAQQQALSTARVLIDLGHSRATVLLNPLIPEGLRDWVGEQLLAEQNRTFERARVISGEDDGDGWLTGLDRSDWYYWRSLRTYLLGVKNRPRFVVDSLDDSSDKILRKLRPPSTHEFDIRGLVLGYVQSGKTANFTALIAKAVDAGYRLVVVLSGIDKGLRRQTQLRLNRELTGYPHNPSDAVRFPPVGKQWHQFTTDDLEGDFFPGRANAAALQGSQPVLIVVKKNGSVLRRLRAWLQSAPASVLKDLPALFIDDEADQASVDTRGSYQTEADFDPNDPNYSPPAVINGLIRELLQIFARRAYVAYTATPFANALIPHNAFDGQAGDDLYPKDFFVDLPKPEGYFGAEELFGRFDPTTSEQVCGLDVVRIVPDSEIATLSQATEMVPSLEEALLSFALAGAARALRGQGNEPCTMLVHTSQKIAEQQPTRQLVDLRFRELRDEWRYDRNAGLRERLQDLWNSDFTGTSGSIKGAALHTFEEVERHLGQFLDSVVVREINSAEGEVLDYELEPSLKAIAVGGNKLSRGLTLDGLVVSYFARRSVQYDTLLQMCRWYGFRSGYVDLTRIYTTGTLAAWFADLALVEYRLRTDLEMYERAPGLRPQDIGLRILQHPSMQVTSRLKSRFGSTTTVQQSYSGSLEQTIRFPLQDLDSIAVLSERNRLTCVDLLKELGRPALRTGFGPLWTDLSADLVVEFLRKFQVDENSGSFSPTIMADWIERQNIEGDVVRWAVTIRGREREGNGLGAATWISPSYGPVWNLSRTRIGGSNSLGVITNPGDEEIGLTDDELRDARDRIARGEEKDRNIAARRSRSSERGLVLLYPISRKSGHFGRLQKGRAKLFEDLADPRSVDLIGLAVSFPRTRNPGPTEAYLEGTAGWNPGPI